jgi:hypothetical protein
MAKRRGAIAERLRAFVGAHVSRRGDKTQLAAAIGRPESFVTDYIAGRRRASLDDAVAIARYFRISLSDVVGDLPTWPQDALEILELWDTVPHGMKPALRGMLEYAASLAPPRSRHGLAPPADAAPTPGARPTREPSARRRKDHPDR